MYWGGVRVKEDGSNLSGWEFDAGTVVPIVGAFTVCGGALIVLPRKCRSLEDHRGAVCCRHDALGSGTNSSNCCRSVQMPLMYSRFPYGKA
jgi:hypothetical protein